MCNHAIATATNVAVTGIRSGMVTNDLAEDDSVADESSGVGIGVGHSDWSPFTAHTQAEVFVFGQSCVVIWDG